MIEKLYIARDLDGRLYKYPYWASMVATSVPHRHIWARPFDGNYYAEGSDYQPRKGEEIPFDLYPEITYDNSPVLVEGMKVEIQKLNIGAIFSVRKNGKEYEYLGFCPIENVPCAKESSSTIYYYEPTDLVYPMYNYQIEENQSPHNT